MLPERDHFESDAGVFKMSPGELQACPIGVVILDRAGIIRRYNRAQEQIAHRKAVTAIGRNFFSDIAPCTAVKNFQGRFVEFARRFDNGIEKFNFTFRFEWGPTDVSLTLVRKAGNDEIALLVLLRSAGPAAR